MNVLEAADVLRDKFKDRDWFVQVVADEKKPPSITVLTKWQSFDILNEIPIQMSGYDVFVHFARKKVLPNTGTLPTNNVEVQEEPELDINDLINEVDRLEKICGSHTLQDIFYEVQDGKNAVTDMSKRYPEVRKSMDELFNTFGFDVIYEEIDG